MVSNRNSWIFARGNSVTNIKCGRTLTQRNTSSKRNCAVVNSLSRSSTFLRSRKTSVCKPTEPADSGHGWNLYVITSVSTLQLYREIVLYLLRSYQDHLIQASLTILEPDYGRGPMFNSGQELTIKECLTHVKSIRQSWVVTG